jgi:hypothetical protein
MGIARLDSPDAPFTFVFPETRNPSLDGRAESFNHSRIRLGAGQRLPVNIGRFHRAEDDHQYGSNKRQK